MRGASKRANGRASGPVLKSVFLAVLDHSGKIFGMLITGPSHDLPSMKWGREMELLTKGKRVNEVRPMPHLYFSTTDAEEEEGEGVGEGAGEEEEEEEEEEEGEEGEVQPSLI